MCFEQKTGKSDRRRFRAGLRWLVCFAVIAVIMGGQPAYALPMFARKYNLACSRCHTMPPRLTNFGYAFYRAGFRLPNNEVKPYTFENSFSVLGQGSFQDTTPGNTGFSVDGVEIDLATAIDKNFAVRGVYQFSTSGDTGTGFNELWAQYNSSPKAPFFAVRAGQLPILSAYQLMGDRQITLTDPMLSGSFGPLTGAGQGSLAINDVERGIAATYGNGGFYGHLSWLNGIDESGAGGISLSGHRANDIVLSTEYFIGKQGTALQAFYYLGKQPLTSIGVNNRFDRVGVFGTYGRNFNTRAMGVSDLRVELNGGLLWGTDAIDAMGTKANSYGSIVEGDVYFKHRTAIAVRYDSAKPSSVDGTPTSEAYTYAITHRPKDFLRLGLEYRNQRQPGYDSVIGQVWLYY